MLYCSHECYEGTATSKVISQRGFNLPFKSPGKLELIAWCVGELCTFPQISFIEVCFKAICGGVCSCKFLVCFRMFVILIKVSWMFLLKKKWEKRRIHSLLWEVSVYVQNLSETNRALNIDQTNNDSDLYHNAYKTSCHNYLFHRHFLTFKAAAFKTISCSPFMFH